MKIDWPALIAVFLTIGVSYVFLLRQLREKNREVDRLEMENQRVGGELLQARSEHAKQMAELTSDHTKRITAVQHNMNDLAALLKERGGAGWDGWAAKQPK